MKNINLLLLWLLPFCAMAQTGQIKGTVIDANSKESLPGATVIVMPDQKLGATTDENGSYTISNLPVGTYTLKISFLNFATQEIKNIEVKGNATTTVDITLKENPVSMSTLLLIEYDRNTVIPPSYDPIDKSVVITDNRVASNSPVAQTYLTRKDLEKINLGTDMPFLLANTPSATVTSDAGTGIGYTALRLRGSDQTRINVTLNGVPVNDAESQNVFWVDLPDLASNTASVQIQRGVGSSTQGAGAFGGTVSILTNSNTRRGAEVSVSGGSFNTLRYTAGVSSGLFGKNKQFAVEARYSGTHSAGFLDRSNANLRSGYFSATYARNRTSMKLVALYGKEITQQAWYGTPGVKLRGDSLGIENFIAANGLSPAQSANIRNADNRQYNYYLYNNQVDNYQQFYAQLPISHEISNPEDNRRRLLLNITPYYTKGNGYYEEYQDASSAYESADLARYGLPNVIVGTDTITRTNLVRRKNLDNNLYGAIWSAKYTSSGETTAYDGIDTRFARNAYKITFGGGYNIYDGTHFNEVIKADANAGLVLPHRYFQDKSLKQDFNVFLQGEYSPLEDLKLFADMQYRYIKYDYENPNAPTDQTQSTAKLAFFNPKAGIVYSLHESGLIAAYAGVAQREPNRDDYRSAAVGQAPSAEQLFDAELNYKFRRTYFYAEVNGFLMQYRNELVPTGKLNDVGAYIRQNVDRSHRAGIELITNIDIIPRHLLFTANATYMQAKVKSTTVYVDDYDNGGQVAEVQDNKNLPLTPNIMGGGELSYDFLNDVASGPETKRSFVIALSGRYTGEQFLDNTQSKERRLAPFFTSDFRVAYSLGRIKSLRNATFTLLVRNLFDAKYSANGYAYRTYYGGAMQSNDFYYPQAGINVLAGVTVKF